MKFSKSWPVTELTVLFFAVFLSRDLLNAWLHSPHDHFGWLALAVWLAPVLGLLKNAPAKLSANFYLLAATIVCGLLGELTEVHFLNHIALALAVGAWMKFSPRIWLWLLAAVAWMPIFGWWLADFSAGMTLIFRLALALAGVAGYRLFRKQETL